MCGTLASDASEFSSSLKRPQIDVSNWSRAACSALSRFKFLCLLLFDSLRLAPYITHPKRPVQKIFKKYSDGEYFPMRL
jgi:hypothetical protein